VEKLIGVTLYNGDIAYIVEITCSLCGGEELDLVLNKYQCMNCGALFSTELPDGEHSKQSSE